MDKNNHINIDGDGNIALQDISGSTVNVNSVDAIKDIFQNATPEYLKQLHRQIDSRFDELKNANKKQTDVIVAMLKQQIKERNIEISHSKNIFTGNISGVGGNVHIGDVIYGNQAPKEDIQAPKEDIFIDENLMYTCNRNDQYGTFYELYTVKAQCKVQSYIIHGLTDHLPVEILPRRFFNEFIQDADNCNSDLQIISIPKISNYNALKTKTLTELFVRYGTGSVRGKLTVDEFVNLPNVKNKDYVVINFIIESKYWENQSVLFEKFSNEFCNELEKTSIKTKFIFFWSVDYKDDITGGFMLKRLLSGSKKKQILKLLQKIYPDTILPELDYITQDDIKTWIGEIERQSEAGISRIYNELAKEFGLEHHKTFTMRQVLDMFYSLERKYKIKK